MWPNCIGHCIGHEYMGHNYIGNNCIGHNYIGHEHTGHKHPGHHYLDQNYIGHNYTGHNYTGLLKNGVADDVHTVGQRREAHDPTLMQLGGAEAPFFRSGLYSYGPYS